MLGGMLIRSMAKGIEMRILNRREMLALAEEVLAMATDRNAKEIPTQKEIKLAGCLIRAVMGLNFADQYVAELFKPEYDEYLKTHQLQ